MTSCHDLYEGFRPAHLVVGVDDSPGSRAALTAIDSRKLRQFAQELLRQLVSDVTNGRGDGVETRVIEGHNVGRVLVDAARDATMLVVGMNPRHGLGYFLGSTATNCVRHAISPVMVVPENWHSTSSDVVPRTEVVRA